MVGLRAVLSIDLALTYTTHLCISTLNAGVVCYCVSLGAHALTLSSRGLYALSLYVEMVWLLTPSMVVVLLIARVLVMQCADAELSIY